MQKLKIVKQALLLLLFLKVFSSDAQIVNIEEKRLQNEDGLKGSIDLEFSFTKNKEEVVEFENNIQLAYKSGKNLYLFLNGVEVIKNGSSDVLNNGFQHLRYNYKISEIFVLEAFAQYQFNQIQEIDKRILLGIGPRIRVLNTDSIRFYIGLQLMKEWEKTNEFQNNYRSTNYISVYWQLNRTTQFISTTYYQPLLSNIKDYRISSESGLQFTISKNFKIALVYELLYDTEVPVGVHSTSYNFNTGIVYDF